VLATAAIGLTSWLTAQGRLPGTLNFQNLTPSHINMTVNETLTNEKEVEYGDFDNDGDLDVVVAVGYADFQQRRNKLYRNDSGVFNEISGAPVIPGFSDTDVTRNAFFRDYDKDGWLDIVVVNDNNTSGQAGRTKIYINNHPGDVFSHYTEEGLLRLGAGTGGAACGAASANFDGVDGDDLYVGNYPGPSQDTIYYNDDTGYFTEMTASHVPSDGDYTVDVASADLNGDGRIDLLVSNFNPNFVYYNNNNGAGSGDGDFDYAGSTQNLGSPGSGENAMEAGDFDNDGDEDIYWTNGPGGDDVIYKNMGNDAGNRAMFTPVANLPESTEHTSRKATVVDLNLDGRLDIIVMKEVVGGSAGRPTILRNVSVEHGEIEFVDWTPGDAFPDGAVHEGWHAAAFDFADDDGYPDIFLGGDAGDHVFKNADSNEVQAADIGGVLPALYNLDPVAVEGSDGYVLEVLARGEDSAETPGPTCGGATGAETYSLTGLPPNSLVAVVLNGCGDYALQATMLNGNELAAADRGTDGVEEYLEFTAPGGTVCLNVTVTAPCNVVCVDAGACCDSDSDGIRDDSCTWCDCAEGSCAETELAQYGDVGGSFGECSPDQTASIHDRNHVIRCFEGTSACHSINADVGGMLTTCEPDGACDLHDANHILESFAGTNACSCGGPAPQMPVVSGGEAEIVLAGPRTVVAGGLIEVRAYVVGDVDALQGYQLDLEATGGRQGRFTLESIRIESQADALLDSSERFEAYHVADQRMFAGLSNIAGAAVNGRAYLATFTYRASSDADGAFVIDVQSSVEPGANGSFLVGGARSHIDITRTSGAVVRISEKLQRRNR
jgi:hypothetical protein